MNTYPRETDELQPFTITIDGQPTLTNVNTSITTRTTRPTTWQPAIIRDGHTCLRITGLTVGYYHVWAQATQGDETATINLGPITIT